jgi:hypothetical protein
MEQNREVCLRQFHPIIFNKRHQNLLFYNCFLFLLYSRVLYLDACIFDYGYLLNLNRHYILLQLVLLAKFICLFQSNGGENIHLILIQCKYNFIII